VRECEGRLTVTFTAQRAGARAMKYATGSASTNATAVEIAATAIVRISTLRKNASRKIAA